MDPREKKPFGLTLTPEEIEKLRDLYDIEGTGTMTIVEIDHAAAAFGFHFEREEVARAMASCNRRAGDHISFEDFVAIISSLIFSQMRGQLTSEQVDILRENFVFVDSDGNGFVSSRELGTLMRILGQTPTQAELASLVAEVDANMDGQLDFAEFLLLFRRTAKPPSDTEQQLLAAFRHFDVNDDGRLSRDEFRKIMTRKGEPFTDEEVSEMFRIVADENGRVPAELTYAQFHMIFTGEEPPAEKPSRALDVAALARRPAFAYASSFVRLWTDELSGAVEKVSVWRPVCPHDYVTFGDVVRSGSHDTPQTKVLIAKAGPNYAEPVSFTPVWRLKRAALPLYVWRPEPPPHFLAVGFVVTSTGEPPATSVVACIHEDVADDAPVGPPAWSSRGVRNPPGTLWPLADTGFFVATADVEKPTWTCSQLYVPVGTKVAPITNESAPPAPLDLGPGWAPLGLGEPRDPAKFRPPCSLVDGALIVASGVICGAGSQHLGTLPAGVCPEQAWSFVVPVGEDTPDHFARVDIGISGRVMCPSVPDSGFVSLDGIRFGRGEGRNVGLLGRSWQYESSHSEARYRMDNNLVLLSGMVAHKPGASGAGPVVVLPRAAHPPQTQAVVTLSGAGVQCLQISDAGVVTVLAAAPDAPPPADVYLDGILYSVSPLMIPSVWLPLTIHGTWSEPAGYRAAFRLEGGMVVLTGRIGGGAWGHLGVLPAAYHPPTRLVFAVVVGGGKTLSAGRLEIFPDGSLVCKGIKGSGVAESTHWISLDGVAYFLHRVTALPGAQRLRDSLFVVLHAKYGTEETARQAQRVKAERARRDADSLAAAHASAEKGKASAAEPPVLRAMGEEVLLKDQNATLDFLFSWDAPFDVDACCAFFGSDSRAVGTGVNFYTPTSSDGSVSHYHVPWSAASGESEGITVRLRGVVPEVAVVVFAVAADKKEKDLSEARALTVKVTSQGGRRVVCHYRFPPIPAPHPSALLASLLRNGGRWRLLLHTVPSEAREYTDVVKAMGRFVAALPT